MKRCRILTLVTSLVGLLIVILTASICFGVVPGIIDDQIFENVVLKNGTEQFERFEEVPFAMDFKVYFFDVKNPLEILKGEKPIVEEVGPFVYSKTSKKKDIVFEDDATISYIQTYSHKFNREKSAFGEDHEVTVANVPLFSVAQELEGSKLASAFNRAYKEIFDVKENEGEIFHKIRVGDYTFGAFGGYKFCQKPKSIMANIICTGIKLKKNPNMEVTKDYISFTLLKKTNLDDGPYLINSGQTDITSLGQVQEWHDKNRTDFWNEDGDCNAVRGTDSTIYRPYNDKESKFHIFGTDICRTVELEFSGEITYKDVPGYRYKLRRDAMDWTEPENSCFQINKTKNLAGLSDGMPSGFTDMQNCLGAPLILSFPHFLWADEEYANTTEGLQSDEEKHSIYVEMEPNTGSPMSGHKRVQFNFLLRPWDKINVVKDVIPAVIPIMWVDEAVAIPDDLVKVIKDEYLTPVTAVEIAQWVLIAVGLALFVGFAASFVFNRN